MGPFEEPLGNKVYNVPFFSGKDRTADNIGITLLGVAAIGMAAHAVLSSMRKNKD